MFLHILSEAERPAFLALASRFMDADADRTEEEVALFAQLKAEMQIVGEEQGPKEDLVTLAGRLVSRQSRIAALLELVGIGHVDSDYSMAEHDVIRELGSIWEISEEELVVVENWVLRLLALMQQAKTLLDGEE